MCNKMWIFAKCKIQYTAISWVVFPGYRFKDTDLQAILMPSVADVLYFLHYLWLKVWLVCMTCKLLIIAAEVQSSSFFQIPLVFIRRIQYHRMLWSESASACRQPRHQTILSCVNFQFLLHYVITIHQHHWQTDGCHAHSISVTCNIACCAKNCQCEHGSICLLIIGFQADRLQLGVLQTTNTKITKWHCQYA